MKPCNLYFCLVLLLSLPGDAFPQQPIVDSKSFTNSIGMQLVMIPAGEFEMGSPKSEDRRWGIEHQHIVEISQPYFMGIHEVTQSQFEELLGFNPSNFSSTGKKSSAVKGIDTSEFPVEWVTFADAMEFCARLSCLPDELKARRVYRLPTEAEWEKACRGGSRGQAFAFGNTLSSKQANIKGSLPYGATENGPDLRRTTHVGSYVPNTYGLFDMHGNVAEWCLDRYDHDYYLNSPSVDPVGRLDAKDSCRVIRGGDWNLGGVAARSAQRAPRPPDNLPRSTWQSDSLGFRVVCVVSEEALSNSRTSADLAHKGKHDGGAEYRIWTSSQGTESKPAKLASFVGDKVQIEYKNGDATDFGFDLLSESDRNYVTSLKEKRLADANQLLESYGFHLKGKQIRFASESELKRHVRQLSSNKNQIKKIEKQLGRIDDGISKLDQERFRLRGLYVGAQRAASSIPSKNVDQRNRAVSTLNSITAQIDALELSAMSADSVLNDTRKELATARNNYLLSAQKVKRLLNELDSKLKKFHRMKLLVRVQSSVKPFITEVELYQPSNFKRLDKILADLDGSILSKKIKLRVVGNTKYASVIINGKTVEMVLDTGASLVSLPADMAARAGVSADSDDPDIELSIADGSTINAKLSTINTMQLGPFELKNVRCAILGPNAANATPLLGMSFLGKFEMKLLHDTVELTQVNPTNVVTSDK